MRDKQDMIAGMLVPLSALIIATFFMLSLMFQSPLR